MSTLMRASAIVEPASPEPHADAPAPVAFVTPYPRAAWRLADPETLGNVVLWVDQILIRHEDARNEVSFNLAYWYSVQPTPGRTREQALSIARQAADAAALSPLEFSVLAQRYSEDLPSRDEGGALGGLSADQLMAWPHVLDALAAVRPGQTSQVVETPYGFHIFYRREPPAEEVLSGCHIVIGHDQAEWLKMQARGPLPSRSRDQALALAMDVYRQAAARPGSFPELVNRYSEHRDAISGGDFGSWSTREPNPFPPRMRRLEQLALGQVGAPIETHLGFEIILRTETHARQQYAVNVVRLPFEPEAADAADDSRTQVLAQADALARRYADQPQRFGAPGEPSTLRLQWQSGRGVPALELQLDALQLGAVAPSPVQAEFSFEVFQRVAPEPVAAAHYSAELPTPVLPDVQLRLAGLPRDQQRELLRQSARRLGPELRLTSRKLDRLQKLQESAVRSEPDDVSAAAAVIQRALEQTQDLLGAEGYERYLSVLRRQVTSALLTLPEDSRYERGI